MDFLRAIHELPNFWLCDTFYAFPDALLAQKTNKIYEVVTSSNNYIVQDKT